MAENIRLHAIRSFYTAQGLVTLEDDVLSVVAQVRELFGSRVSIQLDPDTGWYHLVEHCEDDTDRLIFSTEELDGRTLERLRRADSTSRAYLDPYDAVEREQDALQRADDERATERLNEEGERLAHALKHDGLEPRLPLQVSIPEGLDA